MQPPAPNTSNYLGCEWRGSAGSVTPLFSPAKLGFVRHIFQPKRSCLTLLRSANTTPLHCGFFCQATEPNMSPLRYPTYSWVVYLYPAKISGRKLHKIRCCTCTRQKWVILKLFVSSQVLDVLGPRVMTQGELRLALAVSSNLVQPITILLAGNISRYHALMVEVPCGNVHIRCSGLDDTLQYT